MSYDDLKEKPMFMTDYKPDKQIIIINLLRKIDRKLSTLIDLKNDKDK